jgi:trans-aconitate methyltransferase
MTQPQSWDPDRYERNARFVTDLGEPVVQLLAPQPGERILDLGCGDGVLTERLAKLGCQMTGVDASEEFVAAARARGLDAQVVDGHQLGFENEFDAVFSNAALHWMRRPDEVIAGVWLALKPGGRFVGELGGAGCVAQIAGAMERALTRRGTDGPARNPWYFPTAEEYRSRLEKGGFAVSYAELIPRPTPLPGDVTGWLETFGESFIFALPEDQRADYLAEVREELRPKLCDAAGQWTADYIRLRFAAQRRA